MRLFCATCRAIFIVRPNGGGTSALPTHGQFTERGPDMVPCPGSATEGRPVNTYLLTKKGDGAVMGAILTITMEDAIGMTGLRLEGEISETERRKSCSLTDGTDLFHLQQTREITCSVDLYTK